MAPNPVYGLLLAGGESRRMGTDKALLRHNNRTQLEHMVDIVSAVADKVFVSMRQEQGDDPTRAKFEKIVDRYSNMGPLAGILSAIETEPSANWLIVACDLPNIDSETLLQLVNDAASDAPFVAYKSSYDGLPEPLCALYRPGCLDILRQFAEEGVHCPRKIMLRSSTDLLDLKNPRALDNINTPQDLSESVLESVAGMMQ